MNKEDKTRVRLVFANTQEHDILLRWGPAAHVHRWVYLCASAFQPSGTWTG